MRTHAQRLRDERRRRTHWHETLQGIESDEWTLSIEERAETDALLAHLES